MNFVASRYDAENHLHRTRSILVLMRMLRAFRQRLILSQDQLFPQVRDPALRLRLKRQALDMWVAGMRTPLAVTMVQLVLVAALLYPKLGLVAAVGPALLLFVANLERLAFLRRMAANQAKTRVLAATSHDLLQRVHAVSLLMDALSQRLAGSPHDPLMLKLQAGMASFSELIDEVMDIASMDTHNVAPRAVSLVELISRAEASFGPSATARGLALWLRLPVTDRAPMVYADAALLWRVLGNLISNALRCTPAQLTSSGSGSGGGMVAVRRAHDAQIGPAWRIEVRDDGPGVAADQRELIFEEIHQAHNPHRGHAPGEGYGLGVAVARRMARLMHCNVVLHPPSGLGQGAVFSIALPALESDETVQLSESIKVRFSLLGLRVLSVDDDVIACEAFATLTSSWDVETMVASNSEDAAQRVCEAVKRYAQDVQVCAVSGGAQAEDVFRGEGTSIEFMRKPVRAQALPDWLNSLMQRGLR